MRHRYNHLGLRFTETIDNAYLQVQKTKARKNKNTITPSKTILNEFAIQYYNLSKLDGSCSYLL